MRHGGIYDHIGFGFHRYSTDANWLVPHFEKMLYDQAMIAMAYTEAYQATGREDYARTAREFFTYVLRDMTAPESGFYSAEDADSEGIEGKFYVWDIDEIRQLLSGEEADLAVRVFNIQEGGNFLDEATRSSSGSNILHMTGSLEEIAADLRISLPELEKHLDSIRHKLFSRREKRVHHHNDDKVLTDWNGLMIAALAKGARVLSEPTFGSAAQSAAGFVFKNMRAPDGRQHYRLILMTMLSCLWVCWRSMRSLSMCAISGRH